MNITKLTIQNFRNISDETTFHLNDKFAVIIGINGKGKSTILHALRVACGAYFLEIPEVGNRHIIPDEIHKKNVGGIGHLAPQRPVKVEATGKFPGRENEVTWRRQILEHTNSTTSKESDVGVIKYIAHEKYWKVNTEGDDTVGLPVIAFFGTSRAHGAGRNTEKNKDKTIGRQIYKDGYQDWNEMKASKFHFEEWLVRYDTFLKYGKEYDRTKEAFFSALRIANPYLRDIEIIGNELYVTVDVEGNLSDMLPLRLHSDGTHYFTAMAAELAYRCIVLNGYLNENAITGSTGVVMIDELDLHLHPNWQRHVVQDLKNAFPNIQFVVTTHSPFIVQSLHSKELIILDQDIHKDGDPFRKSIEEVSADEMGVKDIPRSKEFLEMQKVAEEYFELIEKGKTSDTDTETAQLRERLNTLEELYGEDPAFVASLKIERKTKGL